MDPVTTIITTAVFGVFMVLLVTGWLVPSDHWIARPLFDEPEPPEPFDLDAARRTNVERIRLVQRIESAGCHNTGAEHDWEEEAVWSAESWHPVAVYKHCRDCGYDPRRGNAPLPPHFVLHDEDTLEYHLVIPGTREIVLTTLDERLAYETQAVLEETVDSTG